MPPIRLRDSVVKCRTIGRRGLGRQPELPGSLAGFTARSSCAARCKREHMDKTGYVELLHDVDAFLVRLDQIITEWRNPDFEMSETDRRLFKRMAERGCIGP